MSDGRTLCTNCGHATNAPDPEPEASAGVERLQDRAWYAQRPAKKDPGLAMALSLVCLGLGVLYTERVAEFVMILLAGGTLLLLAFWLDRAGGVLLFLFGVLWLIGIAWAHSRALDYNRDSGSHGFH